MSASSRRLRRSARRHAALTASRAAGCICAPDLHTVGPDWLKVAHDDDCPLAESGLSQVIVYTFPRCER